MKAQKSWKSPAMGLVFIILAVITSSVTLHAQRTGVETPSVIRFTGKLVPIDEQNQGRSGYEFEVRIRGEKRWIFLVENARDPSGEETEIGILKDITPHYLYFYGPAEVIDALANPEVAGKPISLRGYLYVGDNIYHVTDIEMLNGEKRDS